MCNEHANKKTKGKIEMEKQEVESLVSNYAGLSVQIGDAKSQIVEDLVSLHDRLCALAQLERDLEAERVKGVTRHEGLLHNAPALVEHLDAHHKQLHLPTQKVWGCVDDAMTAINQFNASVMSGGDDALPATFKQTDRILDFNGSR